MSEIKYINANKLKSDLKECQEILSTTFDDNEEEQFANFLTGVFGVIDYESAVNIQEVSDTKNVGEDYAECDQFVCFKCGIELQEWVKVERDEDDGDITYHDYIFRYCPNCGAHVKD